MSVTGLCTVCGTEAIEDGCDRCGQLVCSDHHDEATGLCTACLSEFDGTPETDSGGRPDGVDEYRF